MKIVWSKIPVRYNWFTDSIFSFISGLFIGYPLSKMILSFSVIWLVLFIFGIGLSMVFWFNKYGHLTQ